MKLITWNVQWCRGIDGRVDPERIVHAARDIADFDVLCLQEVAANFPDPRLAGSRGEDQFVEIAARLPGFTPVRGYAVDVLAEDGPGRRHFGNMILSRHPVRQALRHLLPMPLEPGVSGMRRVAVEAQVAAPGGDLRVVTTHLEYYSAKARAAQVEALRALYAEGAAHARFDPIVEQDGGPFTTILRPESTILCGDFNFAPTDVLYERLVAPFSDSTPPFVDAWSLAHPESPHAPTFRIYEKDYPGQQPYACDFVLVSADLATRVRGLTVHGAIQASDHQPVLLELE